MTKTANDSRVSHASSFAVEMIGRHERRTTGMLFVAFTQLGNALAGNGAEEQKEAMRAMLLADDRLDYDAATDSWADKTEVEAE